MPPIDLTEGAIELLSSGESQDNIQPVLQIVDIRLVNTQNNQQDRYRILLSDGSFMQQGMLGTQMNELVRSEKLQKGSIVRLTQFVCNLIHNKRIVIIVELEVIHEKCDIIGEPQLYQAKNDGNAPPVARPSPPVQSMNKPLSGAGTQSYGSGLSMNGSAHRPNMATANYAPPVVNRGPQSYPKSEFNSGVSRAPVNNYFRPPQPSYQNPPPMMSNRGPIAKNEAPPRIVPIAALNPYVARWTIKARVTAKGELRLYHNARGDGKVFSFDLLDSDGGEIRATCFNDAADQFFNQIEPGRVYTISKGTLKPAQKAFNHLRNDHEIFLDSTSTVQPCFEDDVSIPQIQFHFRAISQIEGMENNSIVDLIGVVSSISPPATLTRKNGTETLKRTLQIKDDSCRSVEMTLWGNFCNSEGQILQDMCDNGVFPILAVKSCRVSEFNGKSVGTISTSQLLIDPDFPEAQKLRIWFENEGMRTPAVSISREMGTARTERKIISQIKDEKLGTSEKPDWITVCATVSFIKTDNFCYTACPLRSGERQCSKKVTNNGDGKWRCDKCDQTVDECDYRYILQIQIQDHTGITWVTAFQETGEAIMGTSAKDLYYLKNQEQDEEKFIELVRNVLFTKFVFKLKVKEETFSDEQRVKSTIVKVEKVNFGTETNYLLDQIAKLGAEESGIRPPKNEPAVNYVNTPRATGASATPMGSHDSGSRFPSSGLSCNTCGTSGHSSLNCPSVLTGPGQSYGNVRPVVSSGASGECYKCHQMGHWAKDCPNLNNAPPAYGGSNAASGGGASGDCYKCHQMGHWAKDCPNMNNAPPAYGSSNANSGRYNMASNRGY